MNDKIAGAIEVLLEKLEQQKRAVIDTKKVINSLRISDGEQPLFTDAELQTSDSDIGPSRADIYYGKGAVTACREFLEWRNRPCTTEEILKGLQLGGFDFAAAGWKDNLRLRGLAIVLGKNSGIFHRLPSDRFGLLAWYPDVVTKKKADREPKSDTNGEQKKTDEVKLEEEEKINT